MIRPSVDQECRGEEEVCSGFALDDKRGASWWVLSVPRRCLRWVGSRLWSLLVFGLLWPYFLIRIVCRAWLRLLKGCLLRTTSVILLLGVGSFVCYKLYCQLRQRFRRRKKSKRETPSLHRSHIVENWISGIEHKGIQGCCVDSDNESDISDVSLPATSQASFGDIPKPVTEHEEAEKQRDGSSSCGGGSFLSDDEFVDMGVGSSNPYEPVRFDSHSGDVRFQGFSPPKTSTPLNIASKNQNGGGSLRLRSRKGKLDDSQPARLSKQSQKETSGVKTGSGFGDFEASVKNNNNNDGDRAPLSDDSVSQDPESLLDSLSFEGGGEASTPWAANDTVSLLANFSIGSLCERNRRTEELISSRADSQGEETDDFSLGGGMVSDSALLRLRNSHSRQLSADSEASDLSIFERAQAPLEVPCEAFETIDKLETVLHDTKQELLDLDADLVSLRVFRKLPANYDIVLEDVNKKNIDGLARRSSIRESRDANADSGSDFGNSLESDSERLAKESSGPSLEWDSLPLSRQFSEQQHESDSTDFGGFSEFSESEDGGEPRSVLGVVRRHSSGNIHNVGMGTLREQIQRILYEESESWKRHLVRSQTLPVDQSLPESDRPLVPRTREPILVNKIAAVPEENTPSPSSASEFASSFAASSDRDTSMDTNGNDLRDVLKDDTVSEFESSESPTCIEDKVMLADYILGLRRQRRHQSGDGMGKSLAAVLSGLEVRSLRRTKGDGYAAIRAAGFQILASGGSILAAHRGANGIYQRFHDLVASPGAKPWLEGWAFHCSLRGVHTLQGFWECLSLLQDLEDQLRLTATPEALLAKKLNADPLTDAKFVEAIKIIMLKSALELFAKQKDSDAPCPLFATVLFSQVTATSPEEYLVHHLSQLGRDRAVPEPELYLLGYALETTLTVVRPSRLGSEDIVNRYPEWQVGSWPEAVLLEHEGHFWTCAT